MSLVDGKRGSTLAQSYRQSPRAKIEEAWALLVPQAMKGPTSKLHQNGQFLPRAAHSASSDATSEAQFVLSTRPSTSTSALAWCNFELVSSPIPCSKQRWHPWQARSEPSYMVLSWLRNHPQHPRVNQHQHRRYSIQIQGVQYVPTTQSQGSYSRIGGWTGSPMQSIQS